MSVCQEVYYGLTPGYLTDKIADSTLEIFRPKSTGTPHLGHMSIVIFYSHLHLWLQYFCFLSVLVALYEEPEKPMNALEYPYVV